MNLESGNWYRIEADPWNDSQRSAFLSEFEESASNIPGGEQRRAASEQDTREAKMFVFLDNLAHKYRDR